MGALNYARIQGCQPLGSFFGIEYIVCVVLLVVILISGLQNLLFRSKIDSSFFNSHAIIISITAKRARNKNRWRTIHVEWIETV